MAGLNDYDIKLDYVWQLTQAANGDVPYCSGFECVMQDITLEAKSQEGELFYDAEWGWSLIDFIQSEDDDLTALEIKERIKTKLEKREIIDQDSVEIKTTFGDDIIGITVTFRFINSDDTYSLSITLDRVSVEVI